MKKYIYNFLLLLVIVFTALACRRPEPIPGPRGPQGPAGPAGPEAAVFETDYFNFTSPNYRYLWSFPSDFTVFSSDMVVAYILWDSEPQVGGGFLDIWRPLPMSRFFDDGTAHYSYDFTMYDVEFKLETNNSAFLSDSDITNGWLARIVVIPGYFANKTADPVDLNDYNAVKERYNLPDLPSPGNAGIKRK